MGSSYIDAKTGALSADELWFDYDVEAFSGKARDRHIQFSLDIASALEYTLNAERKSSGTITCAGVVGANKSSATITCASVVGAARATGTLTLVSAIAGDEVVVNGLTYTAVAGAKADDTEFSIDTSDTAAATDLADSIDDDVRTGVTVPGQDVTATSSLGVVTVTAAARGTAANSIDISSPDATITASGALLTGGVDGDTVTVNGLTYTAVVGTKDDDTQFSVDTNNDACATDLADSIDDDVRTTYTIPQDLSATATTNVVTILSETRDAIANTILLSTSNSTRLARSDDRFRGAVVGDTVTVNGLVYTAVTGTKADDTEFSTDTSDNACATDLADSIDDDSRTGITVPSLDVSSAAPTANTLTILCTTESTVGDTIDIGSSNDTRLARSGNFLKGGHAGANTFQEVEEGKTFNADDGYDIEVTIAPGDAFNIRAVAGQTAGLNYGKISEA